MRQKHGQHAESEQTENRRNHDVIRFVKIESHQRGHSHSKIRLLTRVDRCQIRCQVSKTSTRFSVRHEAVSQEEECLTSGTEISTLKA